MLDIAWIRDDPAAFDAACRARGLAPMSAEALDLDRRVRDAKTARQESSQRRNALSKAIGSAKARGADAAADIAEVSGLRRRIRELEAREQADGARLERLLAGLPNAPAPDVPIGPDESANVARRQWGTPPRFDFEPRPHDVLGTGLGLMDFERAADMSGARFVVLKGALARLERSLAMFMLDLHTREFGYTEVAPPLLMRPESVYGTGNLPKFAEDLFVTTDGRYLVPTAEVPLTNMVRERIVEDEALPLRFAASTPCFRSEAGAAGKDTRGMIRQHQFWKVELVSVTTPETSWPEHERMTACAETVLRRLELPYRVMLLCSGDMGFAASKCYDLEVWMPGQGAYREISSCSNCTDFQARRMRARCRPRGERGTRLVHTLNGSGVAAGRALIALLENRQQRDGSVTIPDVLVPYMDGARRLEPAA